VHAWQRKTDEVQRVGVRTDSRYTTLPGLSTKPVYVSVILRAAFIAADVELEGEIINGIA
jgi:hypothetical protein